MTSVVLQAVNASGIPTGETVLFWVVAPIMVLAALGLLRVRNAVHAALLMVVVMVGLAVIYAAQGAPFLFAAQIVVYTGAVMMLFLFVLMLIGVDDQESLKETIAGQRVVSVVAGLGLAVLLVSAVTGMNAGFLHWSGLPALPVGQPESGDNPNNVANLIFGQFPFALEIVGTLLITAATGAIMLTHRERLSPLRTQRVRAAGRLRSGQMAPLPAPGVYARHNAVDIPALLPDGTPSELTVSRVLRARGQEADETDVRRLAAGVVTRRDEITTHEDR